MITVNVRLLSNHTNASMKLLYLTICSLSLVLGACNSSGKTETKTTDSTQQLLISIRDSIRNFPNEPRLRYNLAIVYKNAGQYREALAILDSLNVQSPDSTDPYLYFSTMFQKSELYEQLKDTMNAIRTLEQFVQPGELTIAGLNLARLYAETKNPRAIPIADSMIRNDEEQAAPEPHYFKGIYYYNTGDFSKAVAAFDESIRNDYTFLDAHLEKGISLYQLKKYAEAIKAFDVALQVSNTFSDAYYWKGRAQLAMGNRDEARLNFERAYGLDKEFVAAKEAADSLDNR